MDFFPLRPGISNGKRLLHSHAPLHRNGLPVFLCLFVPVATFITGCSFDWSFVPFTWMSNRVTGALPRRKNSREPCRLFPPVWVGSPPTALSPLHPRNLFAPFDGIPPDPSSPSSPGTAEGIRTSPQQPSVSPFNLLPIRPERTSLSTPSTFPFRSGKAFRFVSNGSCIGPVGTLVLVLEARSGHFNASQRVLHEASLHHRRHELQNTTSRSPGHHQRKISDALSRPRGTSLGTVDGPTKERTRHS